MHIEGTELEYSEAEGICLDYFLGKHSENKDEWAQRVWNQCAKYKSTGGKGMSKVFARSPESIWEEKKRKRRAAFVAACTREHCEDSLYSVKTIDLDLAEKSECDWPDTHCDKRICAIKDDPKYEYRTADKYYDHKKAVEDAKDKKNEDLIRTSIDLLLAKGFDKSTVGIIYPAGLPYLDA